MAGASLLALLDDIATVLDDVAVMTKVAAKKTAGVLGDDLALNAQQVAGVRAERELPVVWAVAVGSLKNKAILVPAALAISAIAPWLVMPLLMIGGLYLCFEGAEKLAHRFLHSAADDEVDHQKLITAVSDEHVDLAQFEADKIKGAIRTDFVLSAEIIVISLGTVAAQSLSSQLAVLVGISLVMTVGVYGFVAAIVKMDDVGMHLAERESTVLQRIGRGLLIAAPKLMKLLTVVGTAAMFLVGGSIIAHGIGPLHHGIAHIGEQLAAVSGIGWLLGALGPMLLDGLVGIVSGALVVLAVTAGSRILKARPE
jgi:uncharacterized protein